MKQRKNVYSASLREQAHDSKVYKTAKEAGKHNSRNFVILPLKVYVHMHPKLDKSVES